MFERIFAYSDIDRKENRVQGVLGILRMVLFLIPAVGMIMNVISCFIVYVPDNIYKAVYYVASAVFVLMILFGIVRWLVEMFTVYAIDKNGKMYRFQMMAFAFGYLGIGNKAREVAGKGLGKMAATYELIMKLRETIEKLEKEEQIEELILQGYARELTSVSNVKNDGDVLVFLAEGKKYKIRKVYNDWENLFGYVDYLEKNKSSSGEKYVYLKKTRADQFGGKKRGYFGKVFHQTILVIGVFMWLAFFMLGNDMGKVSKINGGLYKEAVAHVIAVEKLENGKCDNKIEYDADGEKIKQSVITPKSKYKIDDEIVVYYSDSNHKKYFRFAYDEHINFRPLLNIFLVVELIILLGNVSFKKKEE